MLANWMTRRHATMKRDDFLFKHFAGASTLSCQLSNMLHRLETTLKDHFSLREMEVPESEDRLRWSLTRYLAAAAKKADRSNIIIVIDGVNALKSEGAPDGALHWLPTELPSNVRVVVSTVVYGMSEEEEASLSIAATTEIQSKNRTYTELQRRKYPELLMAPLGLNVRHRIIDEFIKKHEKSLDLTEKQHFRIVTARATSQPLFLRMLLYALKLGQELSASTIDEQLDLYLAKHDTAHGLISEILDFCDKYVETSMGNASTEPQCVLGRVLAAVYVSRNGLKNEEIWGAVELSMGKKLPTEYLDSIVRILKDVTFVVNGLRTFSHEAFRKVVFSKYIKTPENHIKQHQLMAKFFNRLPPCDRKLDSLAYHLEVSGSWNKLRNALVEVGMFRIWWTPQHKQEFIQLWASLTNRKDQDAYAKKLVTGEFDETTMRHMQTARPHYDIVEEYTRSLEEYQDSANPSDEAIGDVVLQIADFLLEFAMLGHEEMADVPNFVHPAIPNEDLASLGVPHIVIDEQGSCMKVVPRLETGNMDDSKPTTSELPAPKANEETPMISTYFYYRWMWIQFPYVALANCGERFKRGLKVLKEKKEEKVSSKTVAGSTTIKGGKGKIGRSESIAKAHKDIILREPQTKIPDSLIKIATAPLPHLPIRKQTKVL